MQRIFYSRQSLTIPSLLLAACGAHQDGTSEEAMSSLTVTSGQAYTLVGVASNKCVEIAGGSTANGAIAQIATCNGSASQQFRFESTDAGHYRIRNVGSNACLDVEARSTTAGARVLQWACGTGTNQQFLPVDVSTDVARFIARHSAMALDVSGNDTADGTPLLQWTNSGALNQQFRVSAVGSSGGSAGSSGTTTPPPPPPPPASGPTGRLQMERLNRGVVAVKVSTGVFVSWRLFGYEPQATGFNVYRNGTRVNATPITGGTNLVDTAGMTSSTYTVRAVVGGIEQAASETARTWGQQFLSVPLQVPPGGTTPDGVAYTYSAGDASVGDVDGDGQYEIILKWDPSNGKDNSQSGYTGNVYIDAYRLSGQRLWRIDMGRNVRAGAHYTQFLVYDFDGNGRAEIMARTSDGTRDGAGVVIGSATADHRNSSGYVLAGPEFVTVFEGSTGRALASTAYVPARGTVSSWGDGYGNRVDRFLAGVAYLDGARPSAVFARGYYTRTVLAAWDYRNGALTRRWTFDAPSGTAYAGQGNHQLSVADVDADGRQEIVYGAMTVDDNGQGLYTTGLGHGDALHVGDLDPARPGLEVFDIQERVDNAGANLRDARTGAVIWRKATAAGSSEGPGRGVGADIYAGNPGAEFWVAGGGLSGLWNRTGGSVGRQPSSVNFLVWWDGDPVRELLDGNRIDKYGTSGDTRLLTATGASSINGSKSTPVLSGDLLGDWREEVIWRETNSSALRIYTTTATSSRRIYTLVHDAQYRVALSWQNTAYNQPPHPSFFIGDGMGTPPTPDIHLR